MINQRSSHANSRTNGAVEGKPVFTSASYRNKPYSDLSSDHRDVLLCRIEAITDALDAPSSKTAHELLRALITHVCLGETELRAMIGFEHLALEGISDPVDALLSGVPAFEVTAAIRLARCGAELRIVLQGAAAPPAKPDAQLIQAVIEARCRVADYIENCGRITVSDLARRDGLHPSDVSRSMQLAFLAPDIVEQILDGTQPEHLTSESLKRIGELPLAWDAQRGLLS